MRIFRTAPLLIVSTTAIYLEDQDQATARPRLFSVLNLNRNGISYLQEARERAEREAVEVNANLNKAIVTA